MGTTDIASLQTNTQHRLRTTAGLISSAGTTTTVLSGGTSSTNVAHVLDSLWLCSINNCVVDLQVESPAGTYTAAFANFFIPANITLILNNTKLPIYLRADKDFRIRLVSGTNLHYVCSYKHFTY